MDIGEVFRSFLGLRGRGSGSTGFPDGDHHCDCDCDESTPGDEGHHNEFPFFFGHGNSSLDDMFHHFHQDMHEQMESIHRQMDDMMKGFGAIASDNLPPASRPGALDGPESNPSQRGQTWFFNIQEPGADAGKQKEDPRNFMLKEGPGRKPESLPSLPAPSKEDSVFSFKNPFKSFTWNSSTPDQKKDTDLDGKVTKSDVLDLIRKSKSDAEYRPEKQAPSQNRGFFSGQSVTVSTVRGSDGKMETKKTVKDSSGREESTVTRSVNGQTHIVTTITGPEGVEERHENFKNMDENDMNAFEDKWKSDRASRHPLQPSHQPPVFHPHPPFSQPPRPRLNPEDMDIFSRFFR